MKIIFHSNYILSLFTIIVKVNFVGKNKKYSCQYPNYKST